MCSRNNRNWILGNINLYFLEAVFIDLWKSLADFVMIKMSHIQPYMVFPSFFHFGVYSSGYYITWG